MAKLTDQGGVVARCPGCDGGLSTFEWGYLVPQPGVVSLAVGASLPTVSFGRLVKRVFQQGGQWHDVLYLIVRCAGCGSGALAVVKMIQHQPADQYPRQLECLVSFHPEACERLKLPTAVPEGIRQEFREAESASRLDVFAPLPACFVRCSIRP